MPVPSSFVGERAIVIGGSMAGLLAARVLSNHFAQVTIVERDPISDAPEARKGQPHTRHLHGLLAQGLQIMTHYFPELPQSLKAGGAVVDDMALNMHWYCYGNYRLRFPSGLQGALMSRPFLEWQIRRQVIALPNLSVMAGCAVNRLVTTADNGRVLGIEIERRDEGTHHTLTADLVVDATGRGSASPKWLEALGYCRPKEDAVKIDISYATRLYRRHENDPHARDWIFVTPEAPQESRLGGAFPVEGDRWVVTLAGRAGDQPPTDEQGFLDYARTLPTPDIYHLMRHNQPLSEILVHKFPSSLRRRYEHMDRFPEGYLVMGDAICSFNPIYGQGMTSAALQAVELDRVLGEQSEKANPRGMATRFFKRVAKVIDIPWQMAVGEDFRYPQTEGEKAPGTDFINAYVAMVHRATHHDPVVGAAFLKVMNLMAPPTYLFHPQIALRVLKSSIQSRRQVKLRPATA
jgi:2-polyprenyl-6-methoxyphenol hydroxylase-like FAD-dependent oxidoreductase